MVKYYINPLELLFELTGWIHEHPNWKRIEKYELNKLIRNATEEQEELEGVD